MKISLQRLLTFTAGVSVVALVVSGIVKNAKHGFALYLGDVAWIAFLIGILVTLALALAVLIKHTRNRRSTGPVIR